MSVDDETLRNQVALLTVQNAALTTKLIDLTNGLKAQQHSLDKVWKLLARSATFVVVPIRHPSTPPLTPHPPPTTDYSDDFPST